jgi:diadenosine tetraphosphate (Ap4A) HIT family hydrolase
MKIDPQLEADTHVITEFKNSVLLLNKNAALVWFILCPKTEEENLLDLSEEILAKVMREAKTVSTFVKNECAYKKLNIASLGNIVSQLHIHIVGRRVGDPCWPKAIWGNLNEVKSYSESELVKIRNYFQANS